MVSTTSVMAKYSRTFLQIRMILRTSDSSKARSKADVPWRIPSKQNDFRLRELKTNFKVPVVKGM